MNITVVGAGVVGLSCAYELSELGHTVTVIDGGGVGCGGSAGNAGWITPFLSTPRAAPGAVRDAVRSFTSSQGPARIRPHAEPAFAAWISRFLLASAARHSSVRTRVLQRFGQAAPAFFDSLLDRGVEFEQHEDGLAIVFKQQRNLTHYEQLVPRMRGLGYAGPVDVHRGSDVRAFDPAIAGSVAGVLYLKSERHVRPETLSRGLAKALQGNGATIVEHDAVVRISGAEFGGHWTARTESGLSVDSDIVVVAAGFPTRDLLAPLGVRVPLEAAKGTSLTATGEGIVPSHPLKLYENMVACSPFGQSVRLSGTFDIGRRDHTVNRRRLGMVVRHGLSYLADWRPKDVEVEWVGHRSVSVDDTPIVGPVPGRRGLYVACGHGTLGITLGPITGALVAREIGLGTEESLLKPFRLTRF